ncbi:MAG: dihydrofolate reductase [Verrucomicrobiota bacterium]|nr:dihydrofolate reductase [Verrucomicrobiota bacterium]
MQQFPFKAIAAMARNRVIGQGNRIPWHIPDEFRWFKSVTTGHVLVMGRKTFESIGKPLPNRETIVLTRGEFRAEGVRVAYSLEEIETGGDKRDYFICGGAEIYRQALPFCSELILSVIEREVEGDVIFPRFEQWFECAGTVKEHPEFKVFRYLRSK